MTVVLVHGVPECAAIWDPLIAELRRLAHDDDDVVTLSPPGFGVPVPDGFEATSDGYAAWLVDELSRFGEPIDLIGHDWGGGHAMRAASRRPDLVRRLVIDIAGAADVKYVWHDTAQIWQTPGDGETMIEALLAAPFDDRVARLADAGMGDAGARACAAAFDEMMGSCILTLYRSARQPRMHLWGQQFAEADGRPPTLVVVADEDQSTGGPEMTRRVARKWGAQTAELGGLGHWWMTQDPARAARALDAFLTT